MRLQANHHNTLVLSIDQGTTSSRALVFAAASEIVASARQAFRQYYPNDGWVEHDPEDIWKTTLGTCKQAIASGQAYGRIAAVGITNQRETTLIWDKQTGKPVYNAIVWQDRRTAEFCANLQQSGIEKEVTAKTGLLLDSYFSATKINWILDNVPGARKKAEAGRLAFGTVDAFLIWRLTNGRCHLTDATNASRTLLFNIHTNQWDDDLLRLFDVPRALLPEVKNCADDFGATDKSVLGFALPIRAAAGDQQAALVGQACFTPGMLKSTYGTGCFMIMNTGSKPIHSANKLLTTIGYRLNDTITYALEGSIFNAGTSIQWLRDGIGVLKGVEEIERHLQQSPSNNSVYLVPAFTGLGAPHWNPNARGLITGLTRDTDASDLVRAAVESVCYQTGDLVDAMLGDSGLNLAEMRVDGGMSVNHWMLQFLADITQTRICKPVITETTAVGAAYLAGLQIGLFESVSDISTSWRRQAVFENTMKAEIRDQYLSGWRKAVERCLI